MNCPNCNTTLSCGCQKKAASDGKIVCASCSNAYEAKLKVEKEKKSETLKTFLK